MQSMVANRLLRALASPDWDILRPLLEPVELKRGQVLHHARMPVDHVYFPEKALVSVSARAAPNKWAEVYPIGSEGMTGLFVLFGNAMQPALRRVVQVGGPAWRIASHDFCKAICASRSLEALLLRYAAVVLLQSAQAAACNSRHSARQRLAYWLSVASTELRGDVVPLTHSALARLTGIRRPSVTECLGALQREGVVKLSRGTVEVLDHAALGEACYHRVNVVQNEYGRVIEGHRAAALEETRQRRDDRAAAPPSESPHLHEIGRAHEFVAQPIGAERLHKSDLLRFESGEEEDFSRVEDASRHCDEAGLQVTSCRRRSWLPA